MCTENAEKMTLIVFNGELDKALAAFILATGAAAMGMEVTMFFTFWGLNCLRHEKGSKELKAANPPSKSLMGNMLDIMNKGGADKLPLTNMDMMGVGRKMMAGVMKKKGITALPDLMEMANEMEVQMVACQMSMDALEVSKEEFIFPEIEVGGVATYLSSASDSNITLFI